MDIDKISVGQKYTDAEFEEDEFVVVKVGKTKAKLDKKLDIPDGEGTMAYQYAAMLNKGRVVSKEDLVNEERYILIEDAANGFYRLKGGMSATTVL